MLAFLHARDSITRPNVLKSSELQNQKPTTRRNASHLDTCFADSSLA